MRFGFFDQLPCADSQSESQRFHDILAQIELGDQLGFDTVWLGELHFGRQSSILASPLMVLAAAAQRTQRIRLGTAVTLLPLHSPVKIAEEAATADVLSGGRLEFGVGRGTAPIHYTGYNIPQEESRERFEEALDVILKAWTTDRLTYQGRYFHADNLAVVPKPVQKPHPPIRLAANSPDTFTIAGRLGLPIFASPLINPPDKLREYLGVHRDALHRDALKSEARQDVALMFSVHVSDSREQARRECEPSLKNFFRAAGERLRPLGETAVKGYEAFQQAVAKLERATYEKVERMSVFGDPAYCRDRVRALREEFGMDEFIGYFNQGGLVDHAVVKRSMELFAREVIPYCR
ncbi:MAG: LLM class flavin-dependent oxidoreductase [Deltaproteobacteria bacterium]|nr:LLM class flavin-dependent oxidoreductase [Deltaproteobacteria bacterium]